MNNKIKFKDFADELDNEVAKSILAEGENRLFFKKFMGTSQTAMIYLKDTADINSKTKELAVSCEFPAKNLDVVEDYSDVKEHLSVVEVYSDVKEQFVHWFHNRVDEEIFNELYKKPKSDRIFCAGDVHLENAINENNKFNTALIGKVKRFAQADSSTMIKPIKIDDINAYVMIIDEWQARDLMNDPMWFESQKNSNIRGKNSPILNGVLGMYDGVLIYTNSKILRTETGANGTKVGHALFLGAQAITFAVDNNLKLYKELTDYGNRMKFKLSCNILVEKIQIATLGNNWTDNGVINVLTASNDD